MDPESANKIEKTVLEVLNNSDMESTTEFQVRKSASEKLGIDLSETSRKKFVRNIVQKYLEEQQSKAEAVVDEKTVEEDEEEEEGDDEEDEMEKGDKEYDDEGNLIICRLSDKRRVTLSDFRGKNLVSIREYYKKDGKELPGSKGISLTAEQWSNFSKNVPAIEKAIKKLEGR